MHSEEQCVAEPQQYHPNVAASGSGEGTYSRVQGNDFVDRHERVDGLCWGAAESHRQWSGHGCSWIRVNSAWKSC